MDLSTVAQRFPAGLRRSVNRLLGRAVRYRGPYATAEEAKAGTSGYSLPSILESVKAATGKVVSGAARYEQDGIAFHSEPPADHTITLLLLAAARSGGRLSVLDFGGSLGSHYLRWAPLLAQLPELRWCVVEQDHFVTAGHGMFPGHAQLGFESTLEAAKSNRPNVVLAASVLQYVDDPYGWLQRLAAVDADLVIIDRTPFSDDGQHRFFSQHVPPQIYRASYPLQALSAERVDRVLSPGYERLLDCPNPDEPVRAGGHRATYRMSAWLRRRAATR